MENIGKAVDVAGVIAIIVGVAISTASYLRAVSEREDANAYGSYRRSLGRSILLGLEILVAADIIRTVAATPTFESIGVLAGIVLIRTFLSFSLEIELEGRFPWARSSASAPADEATAPPDGSG